ncbi:MAG: hypothetical protein U1F43_19780 [Myxococcota bacterium]
MKADTGGGNAKPGRDERRQPRVGLSLDPAIAAEAIKYRQSGALGLVPSVEIGGQPAGAVAPSIGFEGASVFAKGLQGEGPRVEGQQDPAR